MFFLHIGTFDVELYKYLPSSSSFHSNAIMLSSKVLVVNHCFLDGKQPIVLLWQAVIDSKNTVMFSRTWFFQSRIVRKTGAM